eukprot:755167-Hanusia_phi.AAC.13
MSSDATPSSKGGKRLTEEKIEKEKAKPVKPWNLVCDLESLRVRGAVHEEASLKCQTSSYPEKKDCSKEIEAYKKIELAVIKTEHVAVIKTEHVMASTDAHSASVLCLIVYLSCTSSAPALGLRKSQVCRGKILKVDHVKTLLTSACARLKSSPRPSSTPAVGTGSAEFAQVGKFKDADVGIVEFSCPPDVGMKSRNLNRSWHAGTGGLLKGMWSDFWVSELQANGSTVWPRDFDMKNLSDNRQGGRRKIVRFSLVKTGWDTVGAASIIARKLDIAYSKSTIGCCGLKDKGALTCQKVTINSKEVSKNLTTLLGLNEQLEGIRIADGWRGGYEPQVCSLLPYSRGGQGTESLQGAGECDCGVGAMKRGRGVADDVDLRSFFPSPARTSEPSWYSDCMLFGCPELGVGGFCEVDELIGDLQGPERQ